jgi:hypothetical protein
MYYVMFLKGTQRIFILWKFCLILKLEIMIVKVAGYWNEKKEKLKLKFQNITDEDITFYDNKEKEMMEMLGHKLGKTKDEMRNLIISL